VFVHVKAFARGAGRPQIGQRVSFEVELGPNGKKRAVRVDPVRAPRPRPAPRRDSRAQWGTATLIAIPAFAVLNFIVAVAAAAVVHGRVRELERDHVPRPCDGQGGGTHKSVKGEFRSAFWGTVAINVAAFVFLCSPTGRAFWAAP
jgi:hypothetical protein